MLSDDRRDVFLCDHDLSILYDYLFGPFLLIFSDFVDREPLCESVFHHRDRNDLYPSLCPSVRDANLDRPL